MLYKKIYVLKAEVINLIIVNITLKVMSYLF